MSSQFFTSSLTTEEFKELDGIVKKLHDARKKVQGVDYEAAEEDMA